MWGQAPEVDIEMVAFSTFLARYGVGGGATRRMPKGALMSGFEKPSPSAPAAGKGVGYSFASMSGMLDLSSDENAKHFLPRWLSDAPT